MASVSPKGKYSLDDLNIGTKHANGRHLAKRIIPRPTQENCGTTVDWRNYGAKICNLLNKEVRTQEELIVALKNLMEWQVKNVNKWNNNAYDDAAALLKKLGVENAPT